MQRKTALPPFRGDRLKLLREKRKISREDLGALLRPKHSHTAISNWERAINAPRGGKPAQLAQILGVAEDWFYGAGPDDPETAEGYSRPQVMPTGDMDRALLAEALLAVTNFLHREGIIADPRQLTDLIFAVYDWAERQRAKGASDLDMEEIESFIALLLRDHPSK
ncbi:MAG: helix-turn-helix domain-containing protein [Bacteroidota bacterium]